MGAQTVKVIFLRSPVKWQNWNSNSGLLKPKSNFLSSTWFHFLLSGQAGVNIHALLWMCCSEYFTIRQVFILISSLEGIQFEMEKKEIKIQNQDSQLCVQNQVLCLFPTGSAMTGDPDHCLEHTHISLSLAAFNIEFTWREQERHSVDNCHLSLPKPHWHCCSLDLMA